MPGKKNVPRMYRASRIKTAPGNHLTGTRFIIAYSTSKKESRPDRYKYMRNAGFGTNREWFEMNAWPPASHIRFQKWYVPSLVAAQHNANTSSPNVIKKKASIMRDPDGFYVGLCFLAPLHRQIGLR